MKTHDDSFAVTVAEPPVDQFDLLNRQPVGPLEAAPVVTSSGALTARFNGFDRNGCPLLVDLPGLLEERVPARSTVPLSQPQIGATVVVLLEGNDPRRPIVVGVLQDHVMASEKLRGQAVSVQADEDRFVITAEREIVLRCGEASVTLTRAGKVLIKGAYISSRSSGVHRIKGGCVQIN